MDIKQLTLLNLEALEEFILGAEGEGGDQNGSSSNDSSEGGDSAGGASQNASGDTDDDNGDDDEHEDRNDPKVKGLRSALAKERARANKAEKELNARTKADEEAALKEKTELEQAQIREQKANDRLTKLTEGYRKSAIDRAIEKAAKDFIDPDDAISGVDRSSIEVEQDEDDPSDIKVDQRSVERAVKALAASKPHFLRKGTDDGEATGSGFGGSRSGKNSEKSKEQVYRDRYPSLRS